MTLYLDTSLLVAALTNEPDTPRVQKWFRQVERQDITISDLVVTEMSSSLSIKVRTGQIGLARLFVSLSHQPFHVPTHL